MDRLEIRNPATGELAGSVGITRDEDVRKAVERARGAQTEWRNTRFRDRAEIFRRFHDMVVDGCDPILDSIQSETGKTRRDALAEIVTIAGTLRYYLSHAEQQISARGREPAVPAITAAELDYKPCGVVGLITPWNYPLIVSVGDAIPALLAGNAVVVKPSELTPLTANLARDLLVKAGLPEGLLQVVHGTGSAGETLIRYVDYVGFTGGTATGRKVAMAAAARLIPYSLELGGKNPMIVLEGAPLDEAATGLICGAFMNSGQTCIAVERVYVQNSVYDEFARRLAEQTRKLKIGWSRDWDMDVGSLISAMHAAKVARHIEEARALGASISVGGRRREDLGPAFVEPTVLENVPATAAVSCEETFGPVVSLYRVRDADEAVERANDSQYGLNASVWAKDASTSQAIARRLNSGSVGVDSTLLIYSSFDVPMGGVKLSGIGRRHGEAGILRYMHSQSIVSSIAAGGGYDSLMLRLNRPSRVRALLRILKAWRRLP